MVRQAVELGSELPSTAMSLLLNAFARLGSPADARPVFRLCVPLLCDRVASLNHQEAANCLNAYARLSFYYPELCDAFAEPAPATHPTL